MESAPTIAWNERPRSLEYALWRSVCRTVGRADLAEDPRFASTALRAANQEALRDILEEIFSNDDAAAWLARFREAGVPCAPVNTYSQVLADPQVAHMGWVEEITLPNGASTRTFGPPVKFSAFDTSIRRAPPALGQHGAEIFSAAAPDIGE